MRVRSAVGAAIIGYLRGSFSFARVVGRFAAPDEDVTHTTLALPGGSTVEYEGAERDLHRRTQRTRMGHADR